MCRCRTRACVSSASERPGPTKPTPRAQVCAVPSTAHGARPSASRMAWRYQQSRPTATTLCTLNSTSARRSAPRCTKTRRATCSSCGRRAEPTLSLLAPGAHASPPPRPHLHQRALVVAAAPRQPLERSGIPTTRTMAPPTPKPRPRAAGIRGGRLPETPPRARTVDRPASNRGAMPLTDHLARSHASTAVESPLSRVVAAHAQSDPLGALAHRPLGALAHRIVPTLPQSLTRGSIEPSAHPQMLHGGEPSRPLHPGHAQARRSPKRHQSVHGAIVEFLAPTVVHGPVPELRAITLWRTPIDRHRARVVTHLTASATGLEPNRVGLIAPKHR